MNEPRRKTVWRASMGTFKHEKPRVNKRKAKRTKNKIRKLFLKHAGIVERVKTHDANHKSMTVWLEFRQWWQNLINRPTATV